MKNLILNTRFLFLALLMSIASMANAKEFTYDFMSTIPNGWSSNPAPLAFESASRGCQYTSSATLTLKDAKNVTKVVVTCSSNIAGKNTIALSVGSTQFGSTETFAKETNVEKSFSGNATSGDIKINITRADKSVYIAKVVVTADEIGSASGGGNGGGTGGDAGNKNLDPDYVYGEPTTIVPTGEIGSNAAYSFVQNNILVSTTVGGQAEKYFGCNAGNAITFTATKNIKAVVINGYVKKDFEATASNGEIFYVDASESEVEANPVLMVIDVDSKSVTIDCVKQLRCYSVEVYFDENPELGVGDGGDDYGDYNFDYEPDVATTLNITFDDIYCDDYSEIFGFDYTDLFLVSEDSEMELAVFAPYNEDTILAPGTYEINDSYEEGTVQASPGGDDMYDYPAYIATGFVYDEESEEWLYTASYYIVSGTLTVSVENGNVKLELKGKTAKGSTVNATYVSGIDADGIRNMTLTNASVDGKVIRNGKVVILKEGRVFDSAGKRMK